LWQGARLQVTDLPEDVEVLLKEFIALVIPGCSIPNTG
jgi:hypothetical protein